MEEDRICRQCHAQIADAPESMVCPACGGVLVSQLNLDPSGAPPRERDRRGILLPRRHAAGGVITPR